MIAFVRISVIRIGVFITVSALDYRRLETIVADGNAAKIEAIWELIDVGEHPDRPCHDAYRIADEQLAADRARIARLRWLETELERITSGCSADTAKCCYVRNALFDHSLCEGDHGQPS